MEFRNRQLIELCERALPYMTEVLCIEAVTAYLMGHSEKDSSVLMTHILNAQDEYPLDAHVVYCVLYHKNIHSIGSKDPFDRTYRRTLELLQKHEALRRPS